MWPHDHVLPSIVFGPTHGQIDDAAGMAHVFKAMASEFQNLTLLIQIPGAAGCLAKRIVQIQGPWCANRLRNGAGTGQTQSSDSRNLKSSCDQSDGLMTDGSDRDQQREIYFVFLQFSNQGRR